MAPIALISQKNPKTAPGLQIWMPEHTGKALLHEEGLCAL
jgi:hypothetical protein